MTLQLSDIHRIAKLANLNPSPEKQVELVHQMNGFFQIVEQIQRVDTSGVEPLAHPTAVMQSVALRLADDKAHPLPDMNLAMQNAPAQTQGVFLVPRVIE